MLDFNNRKYAGTVMKMQRNCLDCKYYLQSVPCCDYAYRAGQKRPCKPGDACTVKEIATEEDSSRIDLSVIDKREHEEYEIYKIHAARRRKR